MDHCINAPLLNDLASSFIGRRRHKGEMRSATCKGNLSAELGFDFPDAVHKLEIYAPASSVKLAFS
jgi:hypothetical protein